ncbi:MAG: hypothetical protein MZW92_78540 [Comamonadaceae bacterium]|nr:hypothetical protein [Comamonadaceae bacterium]
MPRALLAGRPLRRRCSRQQLRATSNVRGRAEARPGRGRRRRSSAPRTTAMRDLAAAPTAWRSSAHRRATSRARFSEQNAQFAAGKVGQRAGRRGGAGARLHRHARKGRLTEPERVRGRHRARSSRDGVARAR